MADEQIEHLLRRAGFGASAADLGAYGSGTYVAAVDRLVNYERLPDDVDSKIGQAGYVGTTSNGPFSPNTVINDARQRWLFRMLHTNRPLQEKMALFWHNYFATAFSKISGIGGVGTVNGARYLAAKPTEDAGRVRGQIEMLRDNALGNFKDILYNISTDT